MTTFLNRLTLKWKIFGYLLGFCAILLVILWLFQTVLLDSFYRGIKVMEIKNNAGIIAENIDSDTLSDMISSIEKSSGASVEIVAETGRGLYTNGKQYQPVPISLQDKMDLIALARENDGEYVLNDTQNITFSSSTEAYTSDKIREGFSQRMKSIVFVQIVTTESGDSVAVLINAQISPVNATVTTLRYQLYMITALMILLAVVLAFIIARRISKPIEVINKSARQMAAGQYDVRFRGKGFREIDELSQTLNAAAADLSKVEALRRELMANISHDLRTPLALIYSYAEMMHDFPEEVESYQTQIIMDETQRMTTLVNDILDISKLESGVEKLNLSTYNLTKSIAETTKRLAELVKKDDYQIDFEYDREIIISADESKITQAFYNLLVNAINYTGADKRITISQTVSDNNVRINVTDTGAGVAMENQTNIWDRYYKIEKTHKRGTTGTGLGLAIVKKVIDMHGGDCGVESIPGKNSTFWFRLAVETV